MASGLITISVAISGLAGGQGVQDVTVTANLPNPLGIQEAVPLNSGDNVIALPTGATFVLIIPNAANLTAILVKKVTGDAGIPIQTGEPYLFFPNGASSFILNAASAIPQPTVIYID